MVGYPTVGLVFDFSFAKWATLGVVGIRFLVLSYSMVWYFSQFGLLKVLVLDFLNLGHAAA